MLYISYGAAFRCQYCHVLVHAFQQQHVVLAIPKQHDSLLHVPFRAFTVVLHPSWTLGAVMYLGVQAVLQFGFQLLLLHEHTA